ncbi:hypothetical protein AB6849_21785 [Serratia proteamaculans]|uniref:hypothetical protein n=1 Tax=Serratia proteamaculans TaxID=28151 RepID=UPI001C5A539A|nr:hypothetical protein [Serratia proteamaculans]WEO90889.1 hypothetical protein JET59_006740 [Serratia proteamaculans]
MTLLNTSTLLFTQEWSDHEPLNGLAPEAQGDGSPVGTVGVVNEPERLGFEDGAAQGFSSTHDVNGIEWEHFPPKAQDEKIVEIYGVLVKQA